MSRPERRWPYVAGLVLACALVWHRTPSLPFLFDDLHAVARYAPIRDLRNGPELLAHYFERGLLQVGFALNYAIAEHEPDGDPRPFAFHLVDVALHTINTVLAFWLVLAALTRRFPHRRDHALWAFLVALLFGVAPIATMAVNLVASRSEVQAATGTLLALLAGLGALDRERSRAAHMALWVGSGLAFLAALGAKSVAIATPALFAVVAVLGDTVRLRWMLGGIAAVVGAALIVLTHSEQVWQGSFGGVGINALTQATVVLRYLGLMLWPPALSIDHQVTAALSLTNLASLGALAVLLGMVIAGGILLARRHLLGVCLWWPLIALAPSSSIIPRGEPMLEYRAYLATLGVAAAFVWMCAAGAAYCTPRRTRVGAATACLLTACLLGVATMQRITLFADPVALWADAAAKAPTKARPERNCGFFLLARGEVETAMPHFERAIALNPRYVPAYIDLGRAYEAQDKLAEAMQLYRMAFAIDPDFVVTRHHLGLVLAKLNQDDEAMVHLQRSVERDPELIESQYLIALMLAKHGHPREAIGRLQFALRDDPGFPEAHLLLGALLRQEGELDLARQHVERALALRPEYPAARREREQLKVR